MSETLEATNDRSSGETVALANINWVIVLCLIYRFQTETFLELATVL